MKKILIVYVILLSITAKIFAPVSTYKINVCNSPIIAEVNSDDDAELYKKWD